jgi:hypothetical protein
MTNPDSGERTGIPRWVRLSVIIGVLVAVLVVVIVLMSGGHRIPRHGPGDPPPSSAVAPHVPPRHG